MICLTMYPVSVTVLCLTLLWPALLAQASLHFVDEVFKVVQFTDLHLGEGKATDEATVAVVDTVLHAESDAKLVVLSGDMVSGFRNRYSIQGWFEQKYGPLLSTLASHAVPHAIVLGNHDSEGLLERSQVINVDMTAGLPFSLSQLGHAHLTGAGNYWLDILPSDSTSAAPAARLWFLDSMSRGCAGISGWGCVAPDVVNWLQRQAKSLVPAPVSAAFVHIPVPEFVHAWNSGSAVGMKGEASCCPSCNSGAYGALTDAGVKAIYSGHDHDNDFVAHWNGTRLAYGRKSGYGSYGPPAGYLKGARVIVLREGEPADASETYLRLEDGSKFQQWPSSKPFWKRMQWSCEPGMSIRRMLSGPDAVDHKNEVDVQLGWFGKCSVFEAKPPAPQPDL
eukprot:jgi/Ulvmu1/1754/UM117_0031.1